MIPVVLDKPNSTPCNANKDVAPINDTLSKRNCNSEICEFLLSQPTPEWIKNEKTPDNCCEKRTVKPPPTNFNCKNYESKTVDKKPENCPCDVRMLNKQQQTNEPPENCRNQNMCNKNQNMCNKNQNVCNNNQNTCNNNKNECFDDSRSRQNLTSQNFNNNCNSNKDNSNSCTQKCQFKVVCECNKPKEVPRETCGLNKPNTEKCKRNDDNASQKCINTENCILINAYAKKHSKPTSVNGKCLCKCHMEFV